MISTKSFKKIKHLIFLAIICPSFFWSYQFINDSLGVNPIEKLMDNLGEIALRFILLTLFISSLSEFKKFRFLIEVRRMIGLFAFFYVTCHFLTYIALDHFFDMNFIIKDIIKRPFITCLLYTSDAADEEDSVDIGGRRIIKKKKKKKKHKKQNTQ